jgi:hypothetical protein
MATVQIPPSGVPAEFSFQVPAPSGMDTLGGVRLYFLFATVRPNPFFAALLVNGEPTDMMDSSVGSLSIDRIAQFADALDAPISITLKVNDGSTLDPGNNVSVYAWGAQTETGTGALNPDEGGNPSSLTETIEVGSVEIVSWQVWNRMTGANQGEEGS